MKKVTRFITVTLIFLDSFAFCQNNKSLPIVKNEIGTVFYMPAGRYEGENKGIEIMYTKWKKKNKGIRFTIGYIVQEEQSRNKYTGINDTVYNRYVIHRFNYASAGAGLTFQRNFYKLLYMTASVDTRFMYSNGISVNSGYTMYKDEQDIGSYSSRNTLSNIPTFKWELNPSVGIKFQATHFSMGLELGSYMASMFMPSSRSSLNSIFDFNLGYNFNRICFNYRF